MVPEDIVNHEVKCPKTFNPLDVLGSLPLSLAFSSEDLMKVGVVCFDCEGSSREKYIGGTEPVHWGFPT